MGKIVLTNKNAGTNYRNKLSYKLTKPMRLSNCEVCVSDISMYYSWPNIKSSYGNNKFKYTRLTDNTVFNVELPDGSYEVNDINSYLRYAMERNGDKKDDKGRYPIVLYTNRLLYSVTILTTDKYMLQLPIDGLGKVLGFTKAAQEGDKYVVIGPHTDQNNRGENGNTIPQLERVESVFVHCNLVDNDHQLDNYLLHRFTPDQPYGNLLNIKPNYQDWSNAIHNRDINEIEVWFTDQDNRPLDIKDPKISVILQIKEKKM